MSWLLLERVCGVWEELRKDRQAGPDQKAVECQASELGFPWHTSEDWSMIPFPTEMLPWAW